MTEPYRVSDDRLEDLAKPRNAGTVGVLARELISARAELKTKADAVAIVEWLPIVTAPKDGTSFVAIQNGDIYECTWRQEEPDESHIQEGWFDLVSQSFEEPSHWIPLPAFRPATDTKGGA